MTLSTHDTAAPRAPGNEYGRHAFHCGEGGKRPKDYGPGRVCAAPGCGTILRRTNKGPVCDPCIDNAKARARASACGPVDSPCGEATAKAARPARAKLATKGERMPEQRRQMSEVKKAVLAYLEGHAGGDRWHSPHVIAEVVGCNLDNARYHLKTLVRGGEAESKPGKNGGYRIRRDAAAKAAEAAYKEPAEKRVDEVDVFLPFVYDRSVALHLWEVVRKVGGNSDVVLTHLQSLVAKGELVYDATQALYTSPPATVDDAPASPPAPAPTAASTTSRPEQPATTAPEPPPEMPPAPAPGAGLDPGDIPSYAYRFSDGDWTCQLAKDREFGVCDRPGVHACGRDADDEYQVPSGEDVAEAMAKAQTFAGATAQLIFPSVTIVGHSRAVRVLMDLDEMDEAEREIVLQCAVSLWWLKP